MTKILIVEDETIVALDTKNTLIKLGYEVTDIVTNYDEAISSFLDKKPDIILMDIFLHNSLSVSNEVLNWAYKKSKKVIFRILNLKLKN